MSLAYSVGIDGEARWGKRRTVEWFRTFFDEQYDELHAPIERQTTVAEVRALWEWLRLAPGHEVLDVPCGTGRHSVELAARGVRVVGVDLLASRLERARQRALERGVTVDWVQADMRDLAWRDRFDAVLNLFNSFGYFGPQGDRRALQGMARALKEGGRLLLDLPNRDYYAQRVPPAYWAETATHWVLCAFRFEPQQSMAETAYTFVRKGAGDVVEHRRAQVRWYALAEIEGWLNECGLVVERVYGDWDATPFASDAPRMIVIARRGRHGRPGSDRDPQR